MERFRPIEYLLDGRIDHLYRVKRFDIWRNSLLFTDVKYKSTKDARTFSLKFDQFDNARSTYALSTGDTVDDCA